MENFDLKQTQRYYHLIALKGNQDIIKKKFFNDWQIKKIATYNVEGDYSISQMALTSNYQYYQGEADNSLNGNNSAPFVFDIIIIECTKIDIIILCLPFKKMTVDIITSLLSTYNILVNSYFIKTDLHKLIHANDDYTDLVYNQNHFFLGGVFFSIKGDSFLSTVKLVGDKPLDSDIYKEYFKENLSNFGLEKSIVKCKVEANTDDRLVKLSSTFHIDKFGNYKFYIQSKGRNLLTIPAIFDFLYSINCLVEASNNPVIHLKKEEE
ncbi:MAG: hypothetical protein LBG80_15395 [Bacteroidales bacterium]|jgi:hypothetical protein|nr:hypothetical protein [Bacteroidales bacterium]